MYTHTPARIVQFLLFVSLFAIADKPKQTCGHESTFPALEQRMAKAASSLLEAFTPDLRKQATFALDSPVRTDWHFFPKPRLGVSWKQMNLAQRRAAHGLLKSVLSSKGYLKATAIMHLEAILRELEGGGAEAVEKRDPDKYWFAVFGEPVAGQAWGWRVEGHHLSVNLTAMAGNIIATTPLFLGANPAEITIGPMAGLRVMGEEEDLARDLARSLSANQRSQAVIDVVAPREVITVPGHAIDIGKPVGISINDLTASQTQRLWQLISEFATTFRPDIASKALNKLRTGEADEIHFAWAGALEPGQGHYFRIHGSSFIIEYDNTQNDATHAHAVWHSLPSDFGLDVLNKHYKTSQH